MRNFVVILKNKRQGELSNDLLYKHVDHLKKLKKDGYLRLCGPFTNNDGAMMIFTCNSIVEVQSFVADDPFITENYYQAFEIKEFLEANDENYWLVQAPQTLGNVKD